MAQTPETLWQKIDIILKPVGGLLTALAVGGVGFFGSQFLERRQSAETNVRMYAELMSSREEADASLRKGMFDTIINKFLIADPSDQDQSVLALELLAYNFHDALDLGPLFKDANRKVVDPDQRKRLHRVAKEITGKQIAALRDVGAVLNGSISFPDEGKTAFRRPTERSVIPKQLADFPERSATGEGHGRSFQLEALKVDTAKMEVQVRLQVWLGEEQGTEFDGIFWVGYFDFPMIDNTRLSNGQRCAVVLTNFGPAAAELSLVYFPGSRASLKEKPYYDEVIEVLMHTRDVLDPKSGERKP